MKRQIITNPKILRQKSKDIETVKVGESILKDLVDSLDLEKGLGLSAIQIGIPKRVSIIRYGDIEINLINTKILKKEKPFRMIGEACLSIPGYKTDTKRYAYIEIENAGEIESYAGIIAVAIQHEINHYNGKLIFDKGIKWEKK